MGCGERSPKLNFHSLSSLLRQIISYTYLLGDWRYFSGEFSSVNIHYVAHSLLATYILVLALHRVSAGMRSSYATVRLVCSIERS